MPPSVPTSQVDDFGEVGAVILGIGTIICLGMLLWVIVDMIRDWWRDRFK